jgi:pilus assembly protein CpaE
MRSTVDAPEAAEKPVRSASSRAPLLAFIEDPGSRRVLEEVCTHPSLSGAQIMRGGIATAIEYLAVERSPNVLLVDVGGVDLPVSKLHDLAEVCEPNVTVIAIGDRDEIGLYRDLLHAGVSDYVVKPLSPQLISRALTGHADHQAAPIRRKLAKVIAFSGARGGVGTTTIAVNLAWHLANRQNRRVALLDLDLQYGAVCLLLGLTPTAGLQDALQNPHRIDSTLVERAMLPVGERLFVLASEGRLDEAVRFESDAVRQLLDVLRAEFHYVIIDVPRIVETPYRKALELADLRIVVADQSMHAARDTVRLRASFGDADAQHNNVLVINRAGEGGRHAVTLEEMQTALSARPMSVIPFLPHLFTTAATRGELAVARGGKFADAVADLAAELSGRSAPKRGWRRFGR